MDCETFALRKKFLEEFYKDRVNINGYKYLDIYGLDFIGCSIYIGSNINFYSSYVFNIKKFIAF